MVGSYQGSPAGGCNAFGVVEAAAVVDVLLGVERFLSDT